MISASIVIYKSTFKKLENLIDNCLSCKLIDILYIIDNSPCSSNEFELNSRIKYYYIGKNVGFGEGHNLAFRWAILSGAKYHVVINPDISFDPKVILELFDLFENEDSFGLAMPKILYPDHRIQYLPKLLPSPFRLLLRKIPFPEKIFALLNNNYEFRFIDSEQAYNVPIVSGCFSFFRIEALQKVGGYDNRFFMYFEDFDLSRRIGKYYETIYYPRVFVFHDYERGANKNFNLFKVFLASAIKYFNKWGWFFDKERIKINKIAIRKAKKCTLKKS
jgi:GT2 family glycosyltransferase